PAHSTRPAPLPPAASPRSSPLSLHDALPLSQIINHFLPSAIRTKHFDVRRDSLNTGLISRVHSGCSEVFNLAMHQQPQGPATIRVAEIELKTVQLSEALERRHLEVAELSMRENVG